MISTITAGFIFRGLSLLALGLLIYLGYRSRTVKTWPSVPGAVIESEIETDADRNKYPVVHYRYTVQGREFINDGILPHGRFASTGSYAARVVSKYRVGRSVRVYVNPANPADSTLERTQPVFVYLMLLLATGAFWVMGGLFGSGELP